MVHSDHETRVGAHRIFSVVLVPSSVCPQPSSLNLPTTKATDIERMLSRNVSVFSSSAALFEKLEKKPRSMQGDCLQQGTDKTAHVESIKNNDNTILNRLKSSYSRTYSTKKPVINNAESVDNKDTRSNSSSMLNRLKSSYSRVSSVRKPQVSVVGEENVAYNPTTQVYT